MTARPMSSPARIWAFHGLGCLAGAGAMAGVFAVALRAFLTDQVKDGPLVITALAAMALGAAIWGAVLQIGLGRRWLAMAGIGFAVLLLAAVGLIAATLRFEANLVTLAAWTGGALFLGAGVALGGMGGVA